MIESTNRHQPSVSIALYTQHVSPYSAIKEHVPRCRSSVTLLAFPLGGQSRLETLNESSSTVGGFLSAIRYPNRYEKAAPWDGFGRIPDLDRLSSIKA